MQLVDVCWPVCCQEQFGSRQLLDHPEGHRKAIFIIRAVLPTEASECGRRGKSSIYLSKYEETYFSLAIDMELLK